MGIFLLVVVGAVAGATPEQPYSALITRIEADRQIQAAAFRAAKTPAAKRAVLIRARATLETAIATEILPRWLGTTWAFHGTTQVPGQGEIACGYLVSTVLRDAGLPVKRVALARQASENIIRSLTTRGTIWRFRNQKVSKVIDQVRAAGEGIYLIGLDYHVGFLVHRGRKVEMCHASVLGAGETVCEDALLAEAMVSGYHVLGKLFDDALLRRWFDQRTIPIRTR